MGRLNKTPDASGLVVVRSTAGITRLDSIGIERKDGNTQALFLQLFDNNAPTLGTTVPNMVLPINAMKSSVFGQSGQTVHPKGFTRLNFQGREEGLLFNTGLSFAVTTTQTGAVAPTVGQEPTITIDGVQVT